VKADDMEPDYSVVSAEDCPGEGQAERFDFRLPPAAGLVCVMDAECYPLCWAQPETAAEISALLTVALCRRQGLPLPGEDAGGGGLREALQGLVSAIEGSTVKAADAARLTDAMRRAAEALRG
jgi:hypothetical protein